MYVGFNRITMISLKEDYTAFFQTGLTQSKIIRRKIAAFMKRIVPSVIFTLKLFARENLVDL